jgi:beta-glucanase (GH16 family)
MLRFSPALAVLVSLLIAPAASALAPAQCPALQPESNMVTTFFSDFATATTLDTTQWRPFVGQHGSINQELQAYVASEVKVVPGRGLVLQTDKQQLWEHPFISGEVTTQGQFSQTYGRFEILGKMPQANGLWPAFWLVPANNIWPPEIDIVEYIYAPWGHLPSRERHRASYPEASLHWVDEAGARQAIGQGNHSDVPYFDTYEDWNQTNPPANLGEAFTGYHKYAIDWRPDSLVWFIDDTAVFCVVDAPDAAKRIPDLPMFILLNDAITAGNAARPGWSGYVSAEQEFPVVLDIASVRVAQFKYVPPAPPLPIEIRDVKMSAASAQPGQTVRVEATVGIGNADLGEATDAEVMLRKFDMTQYDGIGDTVASVQFTLHRLAARQHYPVSVRYLVPALPKGLYSVGLSVSYSAGPVNSARAGRHVELKQLGVLEISGLER